MLGLPNQGCIKGTDGSSCEYFIRMAPNLNDSDFLDIYMEGNLKGWVAVGFSRDTFMVNYYQTNNNNYNMTSFQKGPNPTNEMISFRCSFSILSFCIESQ